MKKFLGVILVCSAYVFASWDYFSVIEYGKGEAKITSVNGWLGDFKIRYSPLEKLELMAKQGTILGARYQIIPVLSGGVDVEFPIGDREWTFTPNVQFSTPITEALVLGSNGQVTLRTEDDSGIDFSAGGELDLAVDKKNTIRVACAFNIEQLNKDGDLEIAPTIGYVANPGNLFLGTYFGMNFVNGDYSTLIGLDASIKF